MITGRDAVVEKAAGALAGAPGFVVGAAGPGRGDGDLGLLRRDCGPADQPRVVNGTNFALVKDNRIRALDTLLDA